MLGKKKFKGGQNNIILDRKMFKVVQKTTYSGGKKEGFLRKKGWKGEKDTGNRIFRGFINFGLFLTFFKKTTFCFLSGFFQVHQVDLLGHFSCLWFLVSQYCLIVCSYSSRKIKPEGTCVGFGLCSGLVCHWGNSQGIGYYPF